MGGLGSDLDGKRLTDDSFDRLFPAWARRPSRRHWTPVRVARRAAELLVDQPGARILDVGSGVGKFCLVGALTTRGKFVGIEQRLHFVRVARKAARQLGLRRCQFVQGNMMDLDWSSFDGFYLYNPFAEQLPGFGRIDDSIRSSHERFREYVTFVRKRLGEAPLFTRVVTYHGFGGRMPSGYRILAAEWVGSGPLNLWVKMRQPGSRKLRIASSAVRMRPPT